jgi:hypothetical protein
VTDGGIVLARGEGRIALAKTLLGSGGVPLRLQFCC